MDDGEFYFKIHLLIDVWNNELLLKIPVRFLEETDTDEQASILLGLLATEETNGNRN